MISIRKYKGMRSGKTRSVMLTYKANIWETYTCWLPRGLGPQDSSSTGENRRNGAKLNVHAVLKTRCALKSTLVWKQMDLKSEDYEYTQTHRHVY